MRKIILLVPALLFCVLPSAGAQTDAVKENIRSRVDNGVNAGIVLGIIDSTGVHYFSYGVKSMTTREPVNEHSVFEIGSISKTFTGVILADRVVRGESTLDDPLQKYLPAGVNAPTKGGAYIKLVHLSNHTSSLPRMPDNFSPANPANPFADYSEKQLYEFLNSYKLTRDIGSQYEYSNYAVGLLGHVMAAKKGVGYEKLMIDVIAKPLKMNETRITLSPEMKANLAMGHNQGVQVENWDIPTLAGAGAIRSTAADMIIYLQANMGKLKTKLYPAMQLSHKNSRADGAMPVVGLGWHEIISPGVEIVWHNGGTGGYRTFAGFTKSGSRGVVVLSNSNASVDDIGMHILHSASPLSVSKPKSTEVVPDAVVDEQTLEGYVGQYQLAPGFILTISREGTQLKAQATGQQEFPVFPRTKNIFYLKVVEAQITFNLDEDGKVHGLTLHQGGQDIVGKRIEK